MKNKIIKFFFLILQGALFVSCRTLSIPQYDVQLESNDPKNLTIRVVQISDFHSNDYGKNEEELIQKICDATPDIIVFTGDTFEFKYAEDKSIGNVRRLLNGIKDIAPIFYVNGNHEFLYEHNDEYNFIFLEQGATVLNDNVAQIEINGNVIIVAGVSDPMIDLDSYDRIKLGKHEIKDNTEKYFERVQKIASSATSLKQNLLAQNKNVFCTILLAHRPEYIKEYLKYDFDIILSGHAHGGQWRLPWTQNGLYAPNQGLFPKYSGGRFDFKRDTKSTTKVNNTTFIISRGLSYKEPFFPRIFNKVELVVIEISKNKTKNSR